MACQVRRKRDRFYSIHIAIPGELGSSEAIKTAVVEGLGVACLSHWVVSDWLDSGRLRRLQTTIPKMTRQCYLLVHRDKQRTPALLEFNKHAWGEGGAARVGVIVGTEPNYVGESKFAWLLCVGGTRSGAAIGVRVQFRSRPRASVRLLS
jgi:hypothetical protein